MDVSQSSRKLVVIWNQPHLNTSNNTFLMDDNGPGKWLLCLEATIADISQKSTFSIIVPAILPSEPQEYESVSSSSLSWISPQDQNISRKTLYISI